MTGDSKLDYIENVKYYNNNDNKNIGYDYNTDLYYDMEFENLKNGNIKQNTAVSIQSSTSNSDLEYNNDDEKQPQGLHKKLKARHVSMIAIGGSLGTGLLIGTGTALSTAGPATMLIAYSFVGLLVFFTMAAIGEMASYIPLDGFTSYATRYVDPALGFAIGYCYLFKYLILCPNQLTAASLVIQFWVDREKVNPGVWITIFLVVIVIINVAGIKFFGEFEFWLSSFKVLVMLGLILLMFIIMLGGDPTHDRLGFRYYNNPGAFKPYSDIIDGSKGKFVSFVAVLVYALFAYLGIELTGIVAAEAYNPRRSVPKAIKLTVWRIIIFYLVTILLLGMCVPYNDPKLISDKKNTKNLSASPFVIAIQNSRIYALPHIFNACVLVFVFSACNSDLYVGSRSLYSLAVDGKAPAIFARTTSWGLPHYALSVCVLFCGLGYMNCSSSSASIFNYFVNVVSIFGLISWIVILFTFIRFQKACKAQGIDRTKFSYVAPFQPYGSYFAISWCIFIAFIKNFNVFLYNKFDYKNFITGYIGMPVFVIFYFGYKWIHKTKVVPIMEIDMVTGKDEIDRQEEEGEILHKEAMERLQNNKMSWGYFYEKVLSKVF